MKNDSLVPVEPVFIGGFRSGTTLLVNMLGLHPQLMPWFETKAFCEALRWLRVMRAPDVALAETHLIRPSHIEGFDTNAVAKRMVWDFRQTDARVKGTIASGKAPHEKYSIGNDVIEYSSEDAVASVDRWVTQVGSKHDYETVALATGKLIRTLGSRQSQSGGKELWVNKTPEITRFAPELRDCLGPCKLILMIRDGRQVVNSAAKLGWAQPSALGVWWKSLIIESRAGGQGDPDRFLEVRYEDLISCPEQEIDRVLGFLGVQCCGKATVERYLHRLQISVLNKRLTGLQPEEQASSGIGVDEETLDFAFNRQLGYC